MYPGNTLKLIPPGTRKGNPYYLVRGTFDGRRYEVSTRTRDREAARAFKACFALTVLRQSERWLIPTERVPLEDLQDEMAEWEYLFECPFSVDLEAYYIRELAEAQGLSPDAQLRHLQRRRTKSASIS